MPQGPPALPSPSLRAQGTRKRTLSREAIIECAIALTDERGVEGLTMRNLGGALGVDPMTIYGYFSDKAALFDAVVDSEATRLQISQGPLPADPVEALVQLASNLRTLLLEHPNLAALVAARPIPKVTWTTVVAARLALVRELGIPEADVPLVANAISRHTRGYVLQETGEARQRALMGEDDDAYRSRVTTDAAKIADPHEVAQRCMAHRIDADATADEFTRSLRAMIRGLAADLGDPPPASSATRPDPSAQAQAQTSEVGVLDQDREAAVGPQ